MDFLGLFTLQPHEPFLSLGVWLTWFTGVLVADMLLMIFMRMQPLRKEYRDVVSPAITRIFAFACVGYLLIVARLSEVPVLSMRLWYVLWFGIFFWYLYSRYLAVYATMRLVQRKIANREKEAAARTPVDPYVAAYQKGKKKK